ncbi:uncharacterized protein N0V89_007915 [Didymosphaeria variabile]|uniref:Uncharacterized protein n=1 Tax=Didymosphaeria variabile TaxID=1932322 RepID=A0A9W8XLS0_9PLEO|nr:uncharacterized protein N0V89_007915 [Didymosphaeria variabile]KAJ4352566.1 hypothetical protein N0V89_007915 [Didymosphaeria variabile]
MAFTPTPDPSQTTDSPIPEPTGQNCDACSNDLGSSSCAADDDECLLTECEANEQCETCGFDCSSIIGTLFRRRNGFIARAIISARPRQMLKKLSRRNVIEPTSLARVSDLDRIRSLRKRVEHKPAWKKFAPKGVKYYKMLQDKPLEDKVEPKMCELDAYFDVSKTGPTALRARSKQALFEKLGIASTQSYYAFGAVGPKEGTSIADFQETISAEQGILFANANDRGEKKNGKGEVIQKPIPYQMSTVAWWMWKHTVMLSKPQGDPNSEMKEEDFDFSNFKYFFRVSIKNHDTLEILEEALGKSTAPKEFTPEDQSEDNGFWPLLGSPNGNGIAWFLADHKKSLKGKTIVKLTAWFREDAGEYHMWATIN